MYLSHHEQKRQRFFTTTLIRHHYCHTFLRVLFLSMDLEEILLTITFILDFGRYLAQSLCNIHFWGGGKLKITYASKDTALFDL